MHTTEIQFYLIAHYISIEVSLISVPCKLFQFNRKVTVTDLNRILLMSQIISTIFNKIKSVYTREDIYF